MQKQSLFARHVARDLSPAAPPGTAASETKKTKRQLTARSTAKSIPSTPNTPKKKNAVTNGKNTDIGDEVGPSRPSPSVRE